MALGFAITVALTKWGIILLTLTLVELAVPQGQRQPLSTRVAGVGIWLLFIPLSVVFGATLGAFWAGLGIDPLLTLSFERIGRPAFVVAPLAAALVGDLFFYWMHRAQHRFFWRIHAVHHAVRDLSAVNSYHHISEPIFNLLLLTIPMSLVIDMRGPMGLVVSIALVMQQLYLHSPTSAHLGPLRMFFADNRFHRIHHSLEPRHFDKNFGAFTTLWDRLFGTAHFPVGNEWPDVGVAGLEQPRSLSDWLTLPWRYRPTRQPTDAQLQT